MPPAMLQDIAHALAYNRHGRGAKKHSPAGQNAISRQLCRARFLAQKFPDLHGKDPATILTMFDKLDAFVFVKTVFCRCDVF